MTRAAKYKTVISLNSTRYVIARETRNAGNVAGKVAVVLPVERFAYSSRYFVVLKETLTT